MLMSRTRHRLADERGQSLVEFALVLPILLFVVFGAIELARGVNYWLDANHIANEGARWAEVSRLPAYTNSGGVSIAANSAPSGVAIQNYLASELNTANFPKTSGGAGTTRGVNVCLGSGAVPSTTIGDPVTVAVTLQWPLPLISSLANLFGLSPGRTSIPIHGDATMRLEQQPTYGSAGTCP
jgi:Flp pilus assembly protein TadG